ncbi:MAG: sensor histidine kinase [Vulcanococcus sp.]
MQVSERFLALLQQQLAQFTDRPDLCSLVVYVALPSDGGEPSLLAIGHWPSGLSLPSKRPDASPASGEDTRRWLALRDGSLLLGALRVDSRCWPWPEALRQRLDATAQCLTEALKLDLEQQRLGRQLALRDDQLKLLVHQLRNPLAALRTFGQLLRRRLDGDSSNQDLVDHLLAEQQQLNRYVDAIDQLTETPALPAASASRQPLLLPPAISSTAQRPLREVLEPLLERAAATAALQHRPWQPPAHLPQDLCPAGAVSEILANLLENAFRYSQPGGALGLHCSTTPEQIALTIWDDGPAIPSEEREQIFAKGVRGSTGQSLAGSGLGLALARELAESAGGRLELIVPAAVIAPGLSPTGNGFRLTLPITTAPAATTSPAAAGPN